MPFRLNLLLSLLGLVLLSRLGLSALVPFMDTTEPRYAEIARLMAVSGDWITPWFREGVPFWGKPPLSFWAQALSFRWLGINEFAGRLPSWLANLGIVILVMRTRAAFLPDAGSGLLSRESVWAAIIYSTMLLGFLSAGTVMTDSFLALGTTLALSSVLIRLQGGSASWGWLFFVGLAIGLLAKGPLTLVLTGVPIAAWVIFHQQWRALRQNFPWFRGTGLMLAIAVPWYVLAEIKTPGFLDYFIIGEHFKRFLISDWNGDLYGNAHEFPRGTIWIHLILASFPWGLIGAVACIHRYYRGSRLLNDWHGALKGTTGLVMMSAFTPAVFFSFSGNILWTYVLPGLPFLAVILSALMPVNVPARNHGAKLLVALIVPLVGVGLGLWSIANPALLRTEKILVRQVRNHPRWELEDLVYAGETPFSARFYSSTRVRSEPRSKLLSRLESVAQAPRQLVSVERDDEALIKKLEAIAQPIAQSKEYIAFPVGMTSGKARQAGRLTGCKSLPESSCS